MVRRIDALFAMEQSIDGRSPEEKLEVRAPKAGPVDDLRPTWRAGGEAVARARPREADPRYAQALHAFTLFLDDGRACMSNNAAEHGLRCVALGRKSRLFRDPTTEAGAPQTYGSSSRVR